MRSGFQELLNGVKFWRNGKSVNVNLSSSQSANYSLFLPPGIPASAVNALFADAQGNLNFTDLSRVYQGGIGDIEQVFHIGNIQVCTKHLTLQYLGASNYGATYSFNSPFGLPTPICSAILSTTTSTSARKATQVLLSARSTSSVSVNVFNLSGQVFTSSETFEVDLIAIGNKL